MVQSINTKAIVTLASVLRRPALLVPHVSVTNISEVNYTALQQYAGIEAIIFDKDNTITRPYDNTAIHPNAIYGIQEAQRVFGYNKVAILSNSAGTTADDPDYHDAIAIEQNLHIPVIRHDEKKPGGLHNVLQHFNTNDPSVICMIGDRILTDIVFGNLYGMLTIHTLPFPEIDDDDDDEEDRCDSIIIEDDNNDVDTTENNNNNTNNNNHEATTTNNNDNNTTTTTTNESTNKRASYKDNWTAKIIRPIENAILYNNYYIGRTLRNQRLQHTHWGGPTIHPLTNTNTNNSNNNNIVAETTITTQDNDDNAITAATKEEDGSSRNEKQQPTTVSSLSSSTTRTE